MASDDNGFGYIDILNGLGKQRIWLKNGGGLVRMNIPATNLEEATNDPRIECLPISMSDALLAENTILETCQKIQTPANYNVQGPL